jgi:hypothetical protein
MPITISKRKPVEGGIIEIKHNDTYRQGYYRKLDTYLSLSPRRFFFPGKILQPEREMASHGISKLVFGSLRNTSLRDM